MFFGSYCNFGNFRENVIFVNCIKRHICDAIIATEYSRYFAGGGGVFSRNFAYANCFAKINPRKNFRIYSTHVLYNMQGNAWAQW